MPKQVSGIFAAALLLALGGSVCAQRTPPDAGAAANVRQSQQYEQAVRGDLAVPRQADAAGMRAGHRSQIPSELRGLVRRRWRAPPPGWQSI